MLYRIFSLVIYFIHNILFKKTNIYFCPGLRCSLGFLPLVSKSGGYSLVAVHRLLVVVASLVAEHRL